MSEEQPIEEPAVAEALPPAGDKTKIIMTNGNVYEGVAQGTSRADALSSVGVNVGVLVFTYIPEGSEAPKTVYLAKRHISSVQ